jgi:hypothetical protein
VSEFFKSIGGLDTQKPLLDHLFQYPDKNWLCYTELMPAYSSDTHPRMENLQIRLLREAPPWRKMEMLAELNAAANTLALAGLRRLHPQSGEAELRRALADLLLGEDLARKVYG